MRSSCCREYQFVLGLLILTAAAIFYPPLPASELLSLLCWRSVISFLVDQTIVKFKEKDTFYVMIFKSRKIIRSNAETILLDFVSCFSCRDFFFTSTIRVILLRLKPKI